MVDNTETLRSHSFSEAVPRQIRQDGKTLVLFRCQKCWRDFVRGSDPATPWQAAYVGVLRVELLSERVNQRWMAEHCPMRLIPSDDDDRARRRSETSRHAD